MLHFSIPVTKESACKRPATPDTLDVALAKCSFDDIASIWNYLWRDLETYDESVSWLPLSDLGIEFLFYTLPSVRDGLSNRRTWVKLARIARASYPRLARVFESTLNIDSVALHKSNSRPDDRLTLRDLKDDAGLLTNDHMSKKGVENWKAGPGRKKAWKTARTLRFANQDKTRLLRYSQKRKAIQNSELIPSIRQAPISSSIPTVMLEHGKSGRRRCLACPKPSAVKDLARRLGIPTSHTSWPRPRSRTLYPSADRFVDGDGGDGVEDQEDNDCSFEPGSWSGQSEDGLFPNMSDAT